MPSVHQDGELGLTGPAHVGEGVERRPDGPPRVQDVVHDDHTLLRDVGGDLGRWRAGGAPQVTIVAADVPIVPVRADVQLPNGHLDSFELLDEVAE